MKLPEDKHQAVIENAPVDVVERFWRNARAKALKDVVEPGHRKMRMLGERALAVGIEVFGDRSDALLLEAVGEREGKRVEAAVAGVHWVISDAEAHISTQSPANVNSRAQYTEHVCILGCNYDDLVVTDHI